MSKYSVLQIDINVSAMKTFLLASRHNIMFKCYDQDQSTMKILIQKTSLYLFIQMLCSVKILDSVDNNMRNFN